MTESVVVLLLALSFLNRKLQLALHLTHEEVVDHDVIGRIIQFVLDSDQFELVYHQITIVKQIHCFKNADEVTFRTLVLGSHEVTHSEKDEVYVMILFRCYSCGHYVLTCLQKVVD